MNKEQNHSMNDDLLIKHILKETNDQENQQVHLWLSESMNHISYYDKLKKIWDISEDALTLDVDENLAWNAVNQRITKRNFQEKSSTALYRSLKIITRIAAVLIIIFGVYTLWPDRNPEFTLINVAASDSIKQVILPDGSTVILNKNSSLNYEANFLGETRKVKLSGEAFFEVQRDTSKAFEVQTNLAMVSVLGTSFNVNAFDSTEVEVRVETGKVKVQSRNFTLQQDLILEKNEVAEVKQQEEIILKTEVDSEAIYDWRENSLVFDRASLMKVILKLEEVYQVSIILDENLREQQITVSFNNQDIDNILEIISLTLNLKLTKNETYFELESYEN